MKRGLVLLLATSLVPAAVRAQESLSLEVAGGQPSPVSLFRDRGFAAFPASALTRLGWTVTPEDDGWWLELPGHARIVARPGWPFLRWGDSTLVQLAEAPYVEDGELRVPLQLATDVLPDRLPALFAAPDALHLRRIGAIPSSLRPAPVRRVVVIDPGHGGEDPGAMGPRGTREKDVALSVARALAEELKQHPELEVHLTRDSDVLVPLWQRGEMATRWKGDGAGVFISIHANALPSRSVRGVETYFLSEARTDHERRVAALENAPLALERGPSGPAAGDPDLDFIINELRNSDSQHWSAELAELVQTDLADVHPGPDRGVKQAPFAVITNAIMPAVLVETGFITNPQEERALGDSTFQKKAAGAIARAVVEFFERYPPGQAETSRGGR